MKQIMAINGFNDTCYLTKNRQEYFIIVHIFCHYQ